MHDFLTLRSYAEAALRKSIEPTEEQIHAFRAWLEFFYERYEADDIRVYDREVMRDV